MAKDFPGKDLDLVTFFDCLHDMGDPVGAARHVRQTLKPDGSWMIVEPAAGDRLEDNLNPVSRMYYAASTMICVPTSLDQPVGAALGAQAGFARLSSVITEGGFGTGAQGDGNAVQHGPGGAALKLGVAIRLRRYASGVDVGQTPARQLKRPDSPNCDDHRTSVQRPRYVDPPAGRNAS